MWKKMWKMEYCNFDPLMEVERRRGQANKDNSIACGKWDCGDGLKKLLLPQVIHK